MKLLKWIYNIISALVLLALLALAVLLVGVRGFGFTPYAVLSGSMEPLYPVGAVVYVKEVQAQDIAVGDAITFTISGGGALVTHQVVAIDQTTGSFTTQGLANDSPDAAPVTMESVVGKVHFSVPYLGYIANYVTSPPWIYLIGAGVVAWAIILYMVELALQDSQENAKAADAQPQ